VVTGEPEPEVKTVEYFLRQIQGLVRAVYNNILGGEFIDIMADLISGQLTQAANQALQEANVTMTDSIRAAVESAILSEYTHVDQYYRDIVDAKVDGTSIEPLLARAQMWATRWNDVYNMVKTMIAAEFGQKLEWVYGDTDHCTTCQSLNGIVAYASEWDMLNIHPQGAPNGALECGGWRCQCQLVVTEKRKTPNALNLIMNATVKIR
jgi:hypothetical protein